MTPQRKSGILFLFSSVCAAVPAIYLIVILGTSPAEMLSVVSNRDTWPFLVPFAVLSVVYGLTGLVLVNTEPLGHLATLALLTLCWIAALVVAISLGGVAVLLVGPVVAWMLGMRMDKHA